MNQLRLTKPWITEAEHKAVQKVLGSGWLTEGDVTRQFEEALAKYVGAKHAVAVCNCTVALELAMKAHDIVGRAVLPSFTHPATVRAIINANATPMFCDVDMATYNMQHLVPHDASFIAQAIVPISWGGNPFTANPHRIEVIEDAACSLGASVKGNKTGSKHTTCFSFHPRKLVSTGEGGAVTTNDDVVASKIREMKHFGVGNYKLSDINSAIGLVQLGRIDTIIARRRKMAKVYTDLLANHKKRCTPPSETEGTLHTYQTYAVYLKTGNRDTVIANLAAKGIETQIGAYALHMFPQYKACHQLGSLENSEDLARNLLALPMAYDISEEEQKHVVEALALELS